MPVGTLFVVATPVGNLEDITHRAVRILSEADVIACEDTRHSRRLLDHLGVSRPLVSYHDHNENERSSELIRRLEEGSKVALISDAGTPLISDPGYRIVREAAAAGIPVVPVPGASAFVAALSASGLPTDAFYFGGFLPARESARRRTLQEVATYDCTLVFYEAPHRIVEALETVESVLGPREIVVCREVTKLHEEFLRGNVSEVREALSARDSVRGEITLLIGRPSAPPPSDKTVAEAVAERIAAGEPAMDAVKAVARERGLPKRQVYAEYEQARR